MQYIAPEKISDAVKALAQAKGSVHLLAGGSDLLVRMKGGFVEPDVIVDVKRIKSMGKIKKAGGGFSIGGAVSCAEMGDNAALKKAWPGVVEAAQLIGSDQIQGRCTVVGNMCNASPAADSVPALIAANAEAVIQGPRGERRVPVAKIAKGPGQTSLKAKELVEAVELPKRPAKSGDAYLRFIPRTEMDIAVVSAAVSLTLGAKGIVSEARVALGAVAPTAKLVPAAARALVGSKLEDAALEKMAQACAAACDPIDDKRGTIQFRTRVAGVLARRAAAIAYSRAGGEK